MPRNPKRSYVQRRFFSADHVSKQLPGNQTEADEKPAMPLFSIGIETCSEYGSSTGRYQVRCNAAHSRHSLEYGKQPNIHLQTRPT
jgi:hypothetical protein